MTCDLTVRAFCTLPFSKVLIDIALELHEGIMLLYLVLNSSRRPRKHANCITMTFDELSMYITVYTIN